MQELEAKLVINSANAEQLQSTIDKLAGLDSIGGCRLAPPEGRSIKDTYFDRPDGALQAKKVALRIREVNGEVLIALKGPSTSTRAGVSERPETELEWSPGALDRVFDELVEWGIETTPDHTTTDFGQPKLVLSHWGLQAIQERENRRIVRNVLSQDGKTLLAELVIDSLTFWVNDRKVRHNEVEIEAKSQEGVAIPEKLSSSLVNMFPSELVAWDASKLATIKAVEEVVAAKGEDLGTLLDKDGNLTPEAYDSLKAYLSE